MDVISACPLEVASRAWRSIHGTWTLTVVCKASFLLAPGAVRLAPEQEAPNEDDMFWERDGRGGLRAASDIVPFKPRADVVLVGSAWAPPGWQARTITARLAVGELDKAVEVVCERAWGPGGQRVEGFGPIAPGLPARVAQLGPHAGRWSPSRWWEQPFPERFNPAFFNVAPPDQQVRSLQGDEALVLENLNPEHPRLCMRLPAIRPRATVARGPSQEAVPLGCDTLWLDTDRGIGALVWRGWVRLADPREEGAVVVTLEPGAASTEATATAAGEDEEEAMVSTEARPERPPESGMTITMAAPVAPAGEVLPFRRAAPAAADAPEVRALETVQPPTEPLPPLPPLPPPPPMIGPLARPDLPEEHQKEAPVTQKPEAAGATEGKHEPKQEEPPGLPLDKYPLERCAAIAASVARRKQDKARILEENELSSELWEDLKKHWDGEIGKESRRGKVELMRRYDAAYVAQLEVERGPITAEDYARIVVAQERGSAEEVLREMGLPRGALMRLERVWAAAMASAPALSSHVQRSLGVARSL